MNHAVFLDRDGTINIDPGYLGDSEKVKLLPFVAEGIKRLKEQYRFKVVVVSNQSGIARGLITENQVNLVNEKINSILKSEDTFIDSFYFCPHHPDEKCNCRKPSPKMVLQASTDFNIDLKRSYFVGDKSSDIECGINAGTKTILVFSNNVEREINLLNNLGKSPNFVARNFLEVCNYIEKDFLEDKV